MVEEEIDIRKIFPKYYATDASEAEKNFGRYLDLVWRIYTRMQREDPEGLAKALEEARNHKQ